MPKKKVFLSVLVLSAYLAGIGHSLIPHCHHGQGAAGFGHVVPHLPEPTDRQEMAAGTDRCHDDPRDRSCDGLLCFLECLLSSFQHPAPNAAFCHYLASGPDPYAGGKPGKARAGIVLPSFLTGPAPVQDALVARPATVAPQQSPSLPASPHRGPPARFC